MDEANPIQVLVVDDDSSVRHVLGHWIAKTSTPAHVIQAETGVRALEVLGSQRIDLLILEILVPDFDGIEILSLIEGDPSYTHMEVMVVSSVASKEKVRQVIGMGISAYLLKPLEYGRDIERLQLALSRAWQERQRSRDGSQLRILVADPDARFCESACAVLSSHFSVQEVRKAAEVLVKVVRWMPDFILLSPKLPGAPLDFLLDRIKYGAKKRPSIYMLTDSPSEVCNSDLIAGSLSHSFVPETFLSKVVDLVQGGRESGRG